MGPREIQVIWETGSQRADGAMWQDEMSSKPHVAAYEVGKREKKKVGEVMCLCHNSWYNVCGYWCESVFVLVWKWENHDRRWRRDETVSHCTCAQLLPWAHLYISDQAYFKLYALTGTVYHGWYRLITHTKYWFSNTYECLLITVNYRYDSLESCWLVSCEEQWLSCFVVTLSTEYSMTYWSHLRPQQTHRRVIARSTFSHLSKIFGF